MRFFILVAVCFATAHGQGCAAPGGITGCAECNNPELECIECADGYWWKDEFTCLKCPDFCVRCTDNNADDVTECLECQPFYYKTDEATCEFCTGHCAKCGGDFECAECGDGYRSDGNVAIECGECSTGCLTCLDGGSTSCTECRDGYYYVRSRAATLERQESGRCHQCGSRCLLCKSGTTCDLCEPGTTWTGTACTPCIPNCDPEFCETNGGCKQCLRPAYFITPTFHQCRSCGHCVDCPIVGPCTQCEDGYILIDDGTCQACPNIENALTCPDCSTETRQRMFLNGVCEYCPDNCASCAATDSCLDCHDGFYRNNDNLCSPCDASCVTCDDAGADNCDSCGDGQTVRQGECQDCPTATSSPNCATCSGITCTECSTGFYHVATSTEDETECRTCSNQEPTLSEEVCEICASSSRGRFMSQEKCRQCEDNGVECLTCTSGGEECLTCTDGHYVNSMGNCADCISNCKRCNDGTTCMECNNGHYVDGSSQCSECTANCASCDINNLAACTDCSAEFYEEYPSACTACEDSHCVDCNTGINVCTTCEDGYIAAVGGSECIACPSQCKTCDVSTQACTECNPGYFVTTDDECEACGVGDCKTCYLHGNHIVEGSRSHNDLNCHECVDGKFITQELECVPDAAFEDPSSNCDDANCDICLSADTVHCIKCMDGYFLGEDFSCTACNQVTCRRCDRFFETGAMAGDYCYICMPGYNLAANGDCATECAAGSEFASTCTSCPDDTKPVASMGCMACGSNCAACTNEGTCFQCDSTNGLQLDDDMCSGCPTMCDACSVFASSSSKTCTTCMGATESDASDGSCTARTNPAMGDCTPANGCSECGGANLDECTKCATGRVLVGTACLACADDCLSCENNGATNCDICDLGFFLDSNNRCVDCGTVASGGISNCAFCTEDGTACRKCDDGYYLTDTDTCMGCTVTGCMTCPNDHCEDCDAGMKLIVKDTCAGNDCGSNCVHCLDSSFCYECASGYFLMNGMCMGNAGSTCTPNCLTCSSATTCSQCIPGFKNTSPCDVQCIANCDECVDDATCMTCAAGFEYNNADAVCEPCHDDNCEKCSTDRKTCDEDECAAGYTDVTVCDTCPDECKTCTKATTLGDAATCDECKDNFYVNDMSECSACPSNCKVCPSGNCIECIDGFEMGETGCEQESGGNHADCADEDGGVCVRCDNGFYLDPDTNTCESCETNSANSAEYVCTGCEGSGAMGHDAHQSWVATCADCVENCVRCSSATNCFECVSGRYWDGTACQTLSCANPDNINHMTACSMCSTENYNKDDEHQGLAWVGSACIECPRNCLSCTSATSCSSCTPSYSWSSADNACIPCDFDTEAECTGCVYNNRGRYIDGNKLCRLCDEHCTKCSDSPSTCTACESSYFLSGSSCIECTSSDITAEGCASCQETYALWANDVHAWMAGPTVDGVEGTTTCRSCPQNCQVCSVINTCTTCFGSRYFFSDTEANVYQCRECITNCNVCENGEECIECNNGYYYNDAAKTCDLCTANCLTCTHKDACTACRAGFYLTAEKTCSDCTSAVANCDTCSLIGEAVVCSACDDDYYPAEGGSVCSSCIDNCRLCSDGTTCRACRSGYCYDSTSGEPTCRSNSGVNCDLCELRGDDEVSCLTCTNGYYLDICQPCDDAPECLACADAANKCTACRVGTYLTTTDNPTCEACPPLCLECDRGDACSKCTERSNWNAESNACIPCLTGCADCNDAETCNFCIIDASFVDKTNTPHVCTNCVTGCAKCTTDENCETCQPGYRMELDPVTMAFSACAPCSSGCLNCTLSEGETPTEICSDCDAGYILQNDVCLACNGFSNCFDCEDTDASGTIDAGECLECAAGFLLNDDGSQCISCTITGCEYCIDRTFICTDCNGDQLPSPDEFTCGDPCWFCIDDEDCAMEPELNGTEAVAGSPYFKVGCSNGCWAFRIEQADGSIVHSKGCEEDTETYSCSAYSGEMCQSFGEGDDAVRECAICCTGALCNTESPTGNDSGAGSFVASLLVVLVAALLPALTHHI